MTIDVKDAVFFQPFPACEPPEPLTEAQRKAYLIFTCRSGARVDWSGGYHDVGCFLDNLIIIAKGGDEPDLVIADVEDYVAKNWEEEDDG